MDQEFSQITVPSGTYKVKDAQSLALKEMMFGKVE